MTETATAETAAAPRVWKRDPATKPYLTWALVVRNCAKTLEVTLRSVRERTPNAEIVIVETCSNDGGATVEIAQRYADKFETYRGPKGTWNEEMIAVDDMSAARQRSFDLASGTWVAWIDSDDRLPGSEEAHRLALANGLAKPAPRADQELLKPEEEIGGKDELRSIGLEDFLAWCEREQPLTTMIWCPYLYRRDAEGHGIDIHWRERFARLGDDRKRFFWSEAGHEVLVPRAGYTCPRAEFPHLIWIHEKEWNDAEVEYSLRRHSKILLDQWDAGDRTFRRARYLASFATNLSLGLAPREIEFLDGALELAFTDLDRYRARIMLGSYYARRGLLWDARDHFTAAQALRPNLPDAFYAEGSAAFDREDWVLAVERMRKACALSAMEPESEVNPRRHAVTHPSELVLALKKAAELFRATGNHQTAIALLDEGCQLATAVLGRPEVGEDKIEANALYCQAENALNSEKTVFMLHQAWQHLRRNDESQKALLLVEAAPHDQLHHPLVIEMESWAVKIRRHVDSPAAYQEFYNTTLETGWAPLSADMTSLEKAHPRNKWAIEWIKRERTSRQDNLRNLRVLDIGCCDGICGIPLLQSVEGLDYVGVDVGGKHIDHFRELLGELGIGGDVSLPAAGENPHGKNRIDLRTGTFASALDPDEAFDVILAGEIIEHVADPARWLRSLATRLAPNGALLVTTPWGSFDEGHPPEKTNYGTPRDERGHLRAYSAWSLNEALQAAGVAASEIVRVGSGQGIGDAMCAVARRPYFMSGHPREVDRPVAFLVPGALWNWNLSTIEREGMGASEGMIKALAERLAGERRVDVCGPVPYEEVFRGVGCWPKAAIRKVSPSAKIVVSRSPGLWRQLGGCPNKLVLWLQDTTYPDLDAEAAERFESIVCVSRWHRDLTLQAHEGVPAEKVVTIPNWLDPELYRPGIEVGWKDVKQPHRFLYASSPDRGLVKLLELWPRVLELYPDAELHVFYGWRGAQKLASGYDSAWNKRYLTSRRRYEELRHQKGVIERGMVNPLLIALEFQKAAAYLYPGDFHETWGTVGSEACASGCVPVVSLLAGLVESTDCSYAERIDRISPQGEYLSGYEDLWIEGVQRAVSATVTERQAMAREAVKKFGWPAVEALWKKVLA